MTLHRLIAPAALALVLAAGIATLPSHLEGASSSDGAARETARIRAHFDSVLTELAQRDVRALSAEQTARRASLTRELAAYSERGVFPHNYDFPGQAVPYFVDRKTGTRCAVANLLAHAGRTDIVERVSRANNNVWVAELQGDTAFAAWLDANGLTLAEAARIQLPYTQPESPAQVARNRAFMVVTPLALSGVAITSIWNALGNSDGHRRSVSTLGVLSGVVMSGIGVAVLTKPDISPTVGAAALGMGGASIALSMRSMGRQATIASERARESRAVTAAALTPIVDAKGGAGARATLSVNF
jgi:hypothetical protein